MKTTTTEPTGPAPGTGMIHTDICCTGAPGTMTGHRTGREIPVAAVPPDEQTPGTPVHNPEKGAVAVRQGGAG